MWDVALLVHQRIPEWKPTERPGGFRVWLLRTAHRMCLQAIRDCTQFDRAAGGTSVHQAIQSHPQVDVGSADEHQLDWQRWAFQWAARQVQGEVSATMWQAFWLTAVERIPAKEAARRLSTRVGAVYTNKCRVLSKIRDRVQELSRSDL